MPNISTTEELSALQRKPCCMWVHRPTSLLVYLVSDSIGLFGLYYNLDMVGMNVSSYRRTVITALIKTLS